MLYFHHKPVLLNLDYRLKQAKILLLSSLSAFVLGGCASITGSSTQQIAIQAIERNDTENKEIVAVNCEFFNNKGKWYVVTPGSILVNKSNDPLQGICRKSGFKIAKTSTPSETKLAMFGNIIFGGIIRGIIDHKTGAAYQYPSMIEVNMVCSEEESKPISRKKKR